jgi:hypothetical protein
MSTKVRVILQQRYERPLFGGKAVATICSLASRHLLGVKLPGDWDKLSQWKKLQFLIPHIPPAYQVVLIREPRHTRPHKSLYASTLHAAGLPRPPKFKRVQPRRIQLANGNRLVFDDAIRQAVEAAVPQHPQEVAVIAQAGQQLNGRWRVDAQNPRPQGLRPRPARNMDWNIDIE